MISRTAFCSAQAAVMRLARTGPMPSTSRSRSGVASMQPVGRRLNNVEHLLAEGAQELLGVGRADARIMPDERYFSMPLDAVGRGRGRCAQKPRLELLVVGPPLTHSPDAVIHSPAAMVAAWPTTVTTSRCPRALARRTQKPFSAL
jgi:hypothetical protein